MISHFNLLINLMDMKEYGQTKLIIDLFTDDIYT